MRKTIKSKSIIGGLASVCTIITFVPQVIKIIKTNNVEDISLYMYIIYVIGVILWFIYGLLIKSTSIIITNIVIFPMAAFILFKIITISLI
jgi:MtN3 and saliva related transmembrane protein